ncbi:MAG: hypothetical protein V2I33_08835 [Kangiellaceae bacterium]|jgi:hypothetical protein|nr:hypothetical protein [Kangiellaceae bacterium]
MPRLHINGLPNNVTTGIRVKVNANPKGGHHRNQWVLDKVFHNQTEIIQSVAKQLEGATVRVIIEIAGFETVDSNATFDKYGLFFTPQLIKLEDWPIDQIEQNYKVATLWQQIDTAALYREGHEQYQLLIRNEQRSELISWAMAIAITAVLVVLFYIALGWIGVLIAVFFGWLAKVRVSLVTPFSRM